jgi:hypothetical protein
MSVSYLNFKSYFTLVHSLFLISKFIKAPEVELEPEDESEILDKKTLEELDELEASVL